MSVLIYASGSFVSALCLLQEGHGKICLMILHGPSMLAIRLKFRKCSIINPALSLLVKHLVIGQLQNAPNFSAFHWSSHGSLVFVGQHFVTTRVVHIPKRTQTS